MNTLESILFYGGTGVVILGLIVMAIGIGKDIFSKEFGKLCAFLIGGGLICFLFGNFIYDNNTLEYKKADIIITIQDKREDTHIVGTVRRHHYFFCFNDTEKIEVDAGTYRNFNKGDTIVIKKTYCYRIDRETGERTLERVTYNE